MENGYVTFEQKNKVGELTFFHPKGNSLPSSLLKEMIEQINIASANENINVIVIKSDGAKAFCAGASFSELLELDNYESGKEFFMGFARLINAMRKCEKIIIGRIQGKVVGGGVGLVSGCDYAFATIEASLRLSELAIGLGPFVVGPPIERKIGKEHFVEMSLDCKWRDAEWGKRHGFYHDVYDSEDELDEALNEFTSELAERNPKALEKLKKVYWEGTDHWDELLEERAEYSGELVLSEHTKKFIRDFKSQ